MDDFKMYLFTWKSYFYQHFAVLNKMDIHLIFKVRVGAAIFKGNPWC